MKSNLIRRGAWGVLAGLALFSSMPVLSATSVGGVELTGVGDSGTPFVSGTADIEWIWQPGTTVRHSSVLSLRAVNSVTGAAAVFRYRYIRYGQFTWDTTTAPDGVYTVTATVRGTSISSTLAPIYVDNTAPTVEITRPARGAKSIYVNDEAHGLDQTVVVGLTRLEAAASDNLSGVDDQSLTWYLDGVEIILTDGQYDFSGVAPGEHALEVSVKDVARNQSDPATELDSTSPNSLINIVVVGAAAGVPDLGEIPDPGAPDPGEILPSEDPTVPDPSEILPSEDPTVPDPSGILPSEDPQVPDPSQTPDPGTLLPIPPPQV